LLRFAWGPIVTLDIDDEINGNHSLVFVISLLLLFESACLQGIELPPPEANTARKFTTKRRMAVDPNGFRRDTSKLGTMELDRLKCMSSGFSL
jgi:hypothetical protein